MSKFAGVVIVASTGAFLVSGGYTVFSPPGTARDSRASVQTCNIKGNVSIGSGKRIYHVPGQKYYAATRISPAYGERWFCSEAEARAAGWRRARR